MPESGRRVVLLARPGAARERLRAALTELGVDLALEADPTQLGVEELAAARPELAIVALDSVTEAALDRLDAVLLDPAIDVMFEEADVAASRSGWDAARWVRHLAAKLHRHGDVLPPGAAGDPLANAASLQAASPADDLPAGVEEAAPGGSAADADGAPEVPAMPVPAHPLAEEFTPGVELGDYGGFDPVAAEMADAEQSADQVIAFDLQQFDDVFEAGEPRTTDLPSLDLVFESELVLPGDGPQDGGGLPFGELGLDDLRGAPAPVAPGAGTLDAGLDFDFALPAAEAPAASPHVGFDIATPQPAEPAPAFAGLGAGHVLELVDDDGPIVPSASGAAGPRADLDELERRIASLELVEDRPAATGAVLLVAGIGGPDAVRQLLGALPEGFPRPVVVQQRLDGGRYDRLVSQMQRATPLPVDLADAGSALRPGVVYVLPAGVGIAAGADGLCFDDSGDPLAALPPADSAVLLLSGADASLADTLAGAAWADAIVAGQAADGCYDPAASQALAAQGRPTAQPTELAQRLAQRWRAD